MRVQGRVEVVLGEQSNNIVLLLCCPRALGGDPPVMGDVHREGGVSWRIELLACGEQVKVSHLLRLLDAGAEGIELVVCEGTRCRSLDGCRSPKRVAYARRLLVEAGLSPERIGLSRGGCLSSRDLMAVACGRAEHVKG